jgi:hypothetical protein
MLTTEVVEETHGKTASGVPISEKLVAKLADEAKAGYNAGEILRRRGGPSPTVKCAECGAVVPADEPDAERLPCPDCGSLARKYEVGIQATLRMEASLSTKVERAVNEARMGAFVLILGLAVTIGLAAGAAWGVWWGLLAGFLAAIGTAVLVAFVYRLRPVRNLVMEVMHRITGK